MHTYSIYEDIYTPIPHHWNLRPDGVSVSRAKVHSLAPLAQWITNWLWLKTYGGIGVGTWKQQVSIQPQKVLWNMIVVNQGHGWDMPKVLYAVTWILHIYPLYLKKKTCEKVPGARFSWLQPTCFGWLQLTFSQLELGKQWMWLKKIIDTIGPTNLVFLCCSKIVVNSVEPYPT